MIASAFFKKKEILSSNAWKVPLKVKNYLLLKSNYFEKSFAGTPYTVVGKKGRCRLLKFHSTAGIEKRNEALFVIPSLINRYTVLDLGKGLSFIETLVDHGHTVYVLDWGEPRVQDCFATIEDHLFTWLSWGVSEAKEDFSHIATNGKKTFHLFGQCLGGTLATLYTSLQGQVDHFEDVDSLILLTTPIDFSAPGTFKLWTDKGSVDVNEMIDLWGNIDRNFLDQTFKMLTPMGGVRSLQTLWKKGWDRDYVEKHALLEKWVNDSIHFPGHTYKTFVGDFYGENKLFKNQFSLKSKDNKTLQVKGENIRIPILNLYAQNDIIVPKESCLGLSQWVSSSEIKEVPLGGGHIGCVISEKHQKVLWSETLHWLNTHKG